MALTDVMQQTRQVTARQLTEMCLHWARTASCLTVTACHLLTSCTELPDSSSGSIYSPGISPDPRSPTSLSMPGVMQHLWLKCELERHTCMVVSLVRGRCWDRGGEALLAGGISSGQRTVSYHVILFFNLLFIYF